MLAEILDTGPYGAYIWGSFGLGLVIHAWNWLAPRRRRAEVMKLVVEE